MDDKKASRKAATPGEAKSAEAGAVVAIKAKRKLKPEAINANLFGDLMKFSKKSPDVLAPFRKYDTFALAMTEQPREERLMMYGFLMGLSLTAHARRIKDPTKRRFVFEQKNRIFLAVANNFALRKVLNFRLCQSKRFKVVKYCEDCVRKNTEAKLSPRQWKFCQKCEVDRDFYNVLSMFHKHAEGGASLFLGNELIEKIRGLRVLKRARFGQLDEEVTFRKYTFSPKNLVALDLATVMEAARKIIELLEKMQGSDVDRQASHYAHTGAAPRARAPYPPPPAGAVGAVGGLGGSGRPAFGGQRDGAFAPREPRISREPRVPREPREPREPRDPRPEPREPRPEPRPVWRPKPASEGGGASLPPLVVKRADGKPLQRVIPKGTSDAGLATQGTAGAASAAKNDAQDTPPEKPTSDAK